MFIIIIVTMLHGDISQQLVRVYLCDVRGELLHMVDLTAISTKSC